MTGNEWRVGWRDRGLGHGDYGVMADSGTLVAEVKTGQADDAYLLAAAPKLLAACEEALAFVPLATCEHANQNEMGRKNAEKCVKQLQAAIAKAKAEAKP